MSRGRCGSVVVRSIGLVAVLVLPACARQPAPASSLGASEPPAPVAASSAQAPSPAPAVTASTLAPAAPASAVASSDAAEQAPDAGALPTSDTCTKTCTSDSVCSAPDICYYGCCANPSPEDRAEQGSPVTRSGHELLTVLSAASAVAESSGVLGAAGGRDLPETSGCDDDGCAHGAAKYATFSAVMGVRWADLMGFRAGPFFPAQTRCLSAVAQDNEEVQYDHALRRRDDEGQAGGVRAIAGIRQRLMDRFAAAVVADDAVISIADGGAAQDHFKVLRSYFLLGRALHIVQDSFSTFHTTRAKPGFADLTQVMSYVCTKDAPPHPHVTPGVLNLFDKDARTENGDIVRKAGCKDDTVACLKPEYVASVTASKQVWLAFAKAHAAPVAKRAEAAKAALLPVLDAWFKVPAEVLAAKTPVPCSVDSSALIARRRTACLKMTGKGNALDAPFDWNRGSFSDIP